VFSVKQELSLCVIFSLTSDLSRRPPTAEVGLDPRSVREIRSLGGPSPLRVQLQVINK
jgi:hypothetical protein